MSTTINAHPLAALAGIIPPEGILIHLPREAARQLLHDSPFQYRKTHNEAKLAELAQNIKETGGIHQPMLARPRMPNQLRTAFELDDGLELAAGHRRKLGGFLAETDTFPLLVKPLTDDQVRKIQITENLQREDVHPIEEAEGFQALILDGEIADELAVQFGKSRSYVYGRLKLLQACPRVRQACLKGEICTEVALSIARLRTDKLQEKALQRIEGKFYDLKDGGAKSVRNIRDLLAEQFTLDLKSPMFDQTDAMLLPGAGACGDCPKRVGNAPEYSDLLTKADYSYGRKFANNPDVCTDPDCYDAKKKAHLRNEASRLEQSGQTVIDGAKARAAVGADGKVKGAYIALSDVKKELATVKKGGASPVVVTIQDPRSGKTIKAVKRTDLIAAGVKDVAPKQDLEADRKKREAEHERKQVAMQAEQNARLNVLRSIRIKLQSTTRSAFDMVLIAKTAYAGVDYYPKRMLDELWETNDVEALIDTMTADELMLFMFDCALIADCQVDWPTAPQRDLLKVASFYEVDVPAARGDAAAKEPSTPSTAARAQKKAGGKAGKKPNAAAAAWDKAFPPTKSSGQSASGADAGVDLVGDPIAGKSDEAGPAGEGKKDEPADAGVERDPNTSDMFEGTRA